MLWSAHETVLIKRTALYLTFKKTLTLETPSIRAYVRCYNEKENLNLHPTRWSEPSLLPLLGCDVFLPSMYNSLWLWLLFTTKSPFEGWLKSAEMNKKQTRSCISQAASEGKGIYYYNVPNLWPLHVSSERFGLCNARVLLLLNAILNKQF